MHRALQCLDESKAPMMNIRKQECKEWLDDYTECLHRQKQVRLECITVHLPALVSDCSFLPSDRRGLVTTSWSERDQNSQGKADEISHAKTELNGWMACRVRSALQLVSQASPCSSANKLVRHGAALHGDSGVSRATQLMV